MKLRSLPLAIAAAAALLVPVAGLTPAYAVPPDAPTIDNLDFSTPGHVTGTITTAETTQPVAYVRLASNVQATQVDLTAGTGTFDLETWGFGAPTGTATVQGVVCSVVPPVDETTDCSTVAFSAAFTPTDLTPDVTWFSDPTVGPGQSATVTISDPGGGGELHAIFVDGVNNTDTLVPADTPTALNLEDGNGFVRITRCASAQPLDCNSLGFSQQLEQNLEVRKTATASVGAVPPVSSASPTTTFDVTTPRAGSYTLSWHLESAGVPVTGSDGTASGNLVGGIAQDVPLDGTGLPAGDYTIVGTITIGDPAFGTYTDVPLTDGFLTSDGDVTPPQITSITASPTTIYPLVKNVAAYPSVTKFTVTGAGLPEVTSVRLFRNATGALTRTLSLTSVDATHATVAWGGILADGSPAPAGLYLLKLGDAGENISPTVGQVTVSAKKLVLKTWTHTFSPAGTLADSYVGKCSQLRKPSLRGWTNSLGYYANTKCTSQTSKDSLVSTLHAVFLPKAVQYVDIHVSAYGGAATAKPGSKAVIRYETTGRAYTSEKVLPGTLGWHAGITRSTTNLVFPDHSFGWGFYTGFGYRYDVKSFTVVLHYKVLG